MSFNGFQKNRKGEFVDSWWALHQDEGEFGEIAWSHDGSTLYETSRDDKNAYIIISSNSSSTSIKKAVDFSKLFEDRDEGLNSLKKEFHENIKD